MKNIYKAPRGTLDILPNETKIWQKVKQTAAKISERFGFLEIIVPTFENKELFTNSSGETSDIVQKQMFCFFDLKKRELALRPEGTASVARAVIEHGLLNETLPIKLFYILNCFRNERPQSGRYKEFYQFGVELFGSSSAAAEFEVISLAQMFFQELQIKNIILKINSIGCSKCRPVFVENLKKYYTNHTEKLCTDCKVRLEKNPLRVLDCKVTSCIQISSDAPKILDCLCDECKDHFKHVCDLLKINNISFEIDPYIVRGLDYYTKTVFEFQCENLGAQNTICGGGRYDNLLKSLGATPTPSVGFGVGLNRLILLLKDNPIFKIESKHDLYIGHISYKAEEKAIFIAQNLRKKNFSVLTNLLDRSVKSQMKYANKNNVSFSCIIGEDELTSNKISLKDMFKNKEYLLSLDDFEKEFIKITKA